MPNYKVTVGWRDEPVENHAVFFVESTDPKVAAKHARNLCGMGCTRLNDLVATTVTVSKEKAHDV